MFSLSNRTSLKQHLLWRPTFDEREVFGGGDQQTGGLQRWRPRWDAWIGGVQTTKTLPSVLSHYPHYPLVLERSSFRGLFSTSMSANQSTSND